MISLAKLARPAPVGAYQCLSALVRKLPISQAKLTRLAPLGAFGCYPVTGSFGKEAADFLTKAGQTSSQPRRKQSDNQIASQARPGSFGKEINDFLSTVGQASSIGC